MRHWMFFAFALGCFAQASFGQDPRNSCMIPLYRDTMEPGVVGKLQLQYNPRLRGCFQPVEVTGPEGLKVSFASDGVFTEPGTAPARAGLLIGAVYRLKVTHIPGEEGMELFPTVEVIDRLYPPAEREHRFPIPVVLDQDDMERALRGEMVTRVIYLEDTQIAEPVSYADKIQRVYDVNGTQDALQAADRLGRPVAILRIGSRVPDAATGVDNHFLYGCPPWSPIKELPDRKKLGEANGWPEYEIVPVVPAEEPRSAPEIRPNREASRPQPTRTSAASSKLAG